MANTGMTEKQVAQFYAVITVEHFKLRTAYPTQARNYCDAEWDALEAIWLEMFAGVDLGILHEAVMRFMERDRKGFFPVPGQIMGYVEEIEGERKKELERIASERHWAQVRLHEERIANGENCSTCRFCEKRPKEPGYNDPNYDAYIRAWQPEEKEKLMSEALFCQNPDSYKYEGEHGWGTCETILCEHYEPRQLIGEVVADGD